MPMECCDEISPSDLYRYSFTNIQKSLECVCALPHDSHSEATYGIGGRHGRVGMISTIPVLLSARADVLLRQMAMTNARARIVPSTTKAQRCVARRNSCVQ